jgi:hypothetical protein
MNKPPRAIYKLYSEMRIVVWKTAGLHMQVSNMTREGDGIGAGGTEDRMTVQYWMIAKRA